MGTDALAVIAFASVVGWIAFRRPFLLLLMLFILGSFTWRLASSVYIDVAGPLYSVQLFREIGGGQSAVPLVAAQLVTLVPLFLIFSPLKIAQFAGTRVSSSDARRGSVIAGAAFLCLLMYLAILFFELARSGVVPLFEGMERTVYTAQYGGLAHRLLMRYGNFLAFYLGLFFSLRLQSGHRPDARFLLLLMGYFVYLLFAGHRFSAFYSYSSFFVIPLGVVMLARRRPRLHAGGLWCVFLLVACIVIAVVSLGTYRSLTVTRGLSGEAAIENLVHRVMVQPAELWWGAYERIFVDGQQDSARAFRAVFIEPIAAPERNSTIPYLMTLEIGGKADTILEADSNYTGGYPEILFELFGPVIAYGAAFVLGLCVAVLLFALARAVREERYVSVFLIFYVLYAFYFTPVMGMLNFLVNWKFWLKVGALTAWVLLGQMRQVLRRRQLAAVLQAD